MAEIDQVQPARLDEASVPSTEEVSLWRRWRSERDFAARDELITRFLPYARVVAASVYAHRTHNDVDFAEYLQLSSIGLIESVDRYDPERGAQFKTYAAHRMRGAILNGLERLTEKNQQIALQTRLRKERVLSVKAAAQEKAGIGQLDDQSPSPKFENALLKYLAEVGIGLAVSAMLEGTGMVESEAVDEGAVAASPEVSYFRESELKRLHVLLRELVDQLPEAERRVIRYHYQQEVSFEDISTMLGVTRGRISQLHRQALLKLRAAMGQGPPCDIAW